MPSGSLTLAGLVRGVAVALITATVTLAAACSDEDTVDTVPPPWPSRTTTPDGPAGPPVSTVVPTDGSTEDATDGATDGPADTALTDLGTSTG